MAKMEQRDQQKDKEMATFHDTARWTNGLQQKNRITYSIPLKLFDGFNVVCKNLQARIDDCLHTGLVSCEVWCQTLDQYCRPPGHHQPQTAHSPDSVSL